MGHRLRRLNRGFVGSLRFLPAQALRAPARSFVISRRCALTKRRTPFRNVILLLCSPAIGYPAIVESESRIFNRLLPLLGVLLQFGHRAGAHSAQSDNLLGTAVSYHWSTCLCSCSGLMTVNPSPERPLNGFFPAVETVRV